jgi:hypothetical protein
LVFAFSRIQARHTSSVKVIAKFIRKGLHFQQTESRLSLQGDHWGQGTERKRKKYFLFPSQEMEARIQNGNPHLLAL